MQTVVLIQKVLRSPLLLIRIQLSRKLRLFVQMDCSHCPQHRQTMWQEHGVLLRITRQQRHTLSNQMQDCVLIPQA